MLYYHYMKGLSTSDMVESKEVDFELKLLSQLLFPKSKKVCVVP